MTICTCHNNHIFSCQSLHSPQKLELEEYLENDFVSHLRGCINYVLKYYHHHHQAFSTLITDDNWVRFYIHIYEKN